MQIAAEEIQMMRQQQGLEVMDTDTGMKALYQALAGGQAQVMVAHGQTEHIKQRLLGQSIVPGDPPTCSDELASPASSTHQEPLRERASTYFKEHLANLIKSPMQQIEASAPLENYGFDSIMALRFTRALEDSFGPLSKTLLFEYPTIEDVTAYFLRTYPEQLRNVLRMEEAPVTGRQGVSSHSGQPQVRRSERIPIRPRNRLHHNPALLPTDARPGKVARTGDIAIIGLAGRYPGARDLHAFWENLCQGHDCITEIPSERWDYRHIYDPDANTSGTTSGKWGGFLEGVDEFDPLFFNISPQEAERIDPQERLFLE